TVSSVSPKYCRRSEWPTIAPRTPSSTSIGAEISPVNAPSRAQWTFCAYVAIPLETTVASDTYGGQRVESTPAGGSNASQNAAASRGPLNIFQFPATSTTPHLMRARGIGAPSASGSDRDASPTAGV